ncbi:PH domain-containing protein [Streptomyces xiangluensis]|uniref:PH domain-containing protein n=1 Tax=Streptomyces xiangluensis TaxID=2665720 RepID=A0ABV8YGW5_9ACTN
MSDEWLPRTYRMNLNKSCGALVAVAIGIPSALLPVWVAEDISGQAKLIITAPVVAFFVWLIVAARRARTIVDREGVRVRGFFARRRVAWSEIQNIVPMNNRAAALQQNAPRITVHVTGRDGVGMDLMYLDDQHVDVAAEVQLIQWLWTELRGPDWAPEGARTEESLRRQARREAKSGGSMWIAVLLIPLIVLMVLPAVNEWLGWVEALLSPWCVLLLWVPLIFVLGSLRAYGRRLAELRTSHAQSAQQAPEDEGTPL